MLLVFILFGAKRVESVKRDDVMFFLFVLQFRLEEFEHGGRTARHVLLVVRLGRSFHPELRLGRSSDGRAGDHRPVKKRRRVFEDFLHVFVRFERPVDVEEKERWRPFLQPMDRFRQVRQAGAQRQVEDENGVERIVLVFGENLQHVRGVAHVARTNREERRGSRKIGRRRIRADQGDVMELLGQRSDQMARGEFVVEDQNIHRSRSIEMFW